EPLRDLHALDLLVLALEQREELRLGVAAVPLADVDDLVSAVDREGVERHVRRPRRPAKEDGPVGVPGGVELGAELDGIPRRDGRSRVDRDDVDPGLREQPGPVAAAAADLDDPRRAARDRLDRLPRRHRPRVRARDVRLELEPLRRRELVVVERYAGIAATLGRQRDEVVEVRVRDPRHGHAQNVRRPANALYTLRAALPHSRGGRLDRGPRRRLAGAAGRPLRHALGARVRRPAGARLPGQDRHRPRLVPDRPARARRLHGQGRLAARLVLRPRPREPEPGVGGGVRHPGGRARARVRAGTALAPVQAALLAWFAEHGRDLPWRRTRDPYAILVSEVMLQQTQVERVIPSYLRWLERWPTARALAEASTADVIREWQGLGYNRRAVNLQRAARAVAAWGWPDDLRELPGVGRYTADAVACFAFGRSVLPVDVNVRRVSERTGRSFSPAAAQALMDLGKTVC